MTEFIRPDEKERTGKNLTDAVANQNVKISGNGKEKNVEV